MSELAVCGSMLQQALSIAHRRGGCRVTLVTMRIGPLAGVEPALLRVVFPLIAVGTACEDAVVVIEAIPIEVYCSACGATSTLESNLLLCAACGAWRVVLLSGDETALGHVELEDDSGSGGAGRARSRVATDKPSRDGNGIALLSGGHSPRR